MYNSCNNNNSSHSSGHRQHHHQQQQHNRHQHHQHRDGGFETVGPRLDKYERFEAWLRENGAQFDLLELREYDSPCAQEEDEAEEKKEPTASSSSSTMDGHHHHHHHRGMGSGTSPYGGGPGGNNDSRHHHYHHYQQHSMDDDEVGEGSEMRGVHSRTYLPPNTVCMAVPRRCLITVEMGQETPIGQAILRSDLDLDAPKHIFLMIYILWDRKVNGTNSFFHPYYEILPQTLSNMPIFWSAEELDYLRGSYLLQQIDDRNEAIAEDYHAICQIAPLDRICTLQQFKWARMCVCSRNFGLQIDGHRTSALVPHADMLNHYRPRETKWTFDEERQAFTITTLQPIPAGAQVYDSYGQKCNHRFLLNYGFAVEDNRELDGFCPNEVPLELTLSPDDPLYSQRLEFWMRGEVGLSGGTHNNNVGGGSIGGVNNNHNNNNSNDSNNSNHKFNTKRVRVCVSNNENTRLLFSLLRAMNCNAEELRSIASPAMTPPVTSDMRSLFVPEHRNALASYYRSCRDIRHPISMQNERMAMLNLLQIISTALGRYPSSLSSDKADLLDERLYPPFSNKRHAKIQVRGEKEVLHHYARWARMALDVMDVIEQELKDEQQRGVEVQLGRGIILSDDQSRSCGYDYIIRRMEEDDESVHHTIVRYCADVLGSLRREEFKNLRRQRAVLSTTTTSSGSSTTPAGSAGKRGDGYC